MHMVWSKIRKKILHKILGEYIIELQAIEMMPDIRSGFIEYLTLMKDTLRVQEHRNDILVEILAEIKLLRVTGHS